MKLNKNIYVALLLVMTIFLGVNLVSAEVVSENVTIVTPGALGVISGTAYAFNCSIQQLADYEADNWTRVKVYLQSSSLTANTSEVMVFDWTRNSTQYDLNGTFSAWQVEDANDYTLKCQLYNGTNYINSTRSSLIVNNTIPDAATGSSQTSTTSTTVTFSTIVVDNETTSCSLNFPRTRPSTALSSQSMTYSGTNCSLQFTNVPEGIYDWYVIASDESDTSTSSLFTTSVDFTTGATRSMTPSQVATAKTLSIIGLDFQGNRIVWIVVLATGVLVIFVIVKRLKK
ncbi:MAG: hypothetical protein KKB31_06135 [Nanoarchaeota archaeon]|nr:hypothetical protein [Nanoarchaeota archaeon]